MKKLSNRYRVLCCACLLCIRGVLSGQSDIAVQVGGQQCFVQSVSLSSTSFSYSIQAKAVTLSSGCDASLINVSPLYIEGTCLPPKPRNDQVECSDAMYAAKGPGSVDGAQVSVEDEDAACNKAASTGVRDVVSLEGDTNTKVDSGYVSNGVSSTGYVFIQNNCPSTSGTASIMLYISQSDIDGTYSEDIVSTQYDDSTLTYRTYDTSWSGWWLWIVIAFLGVSVLLSSFCFFMRRRRKMMMMQQGTQMATMGVDPNYSYGYGNYHPNQAPSVPNTYYTESNLDNPPPGYPGATPPVMGSPTVYTQPPPVVGQPAVWYNREGEKSSQT